MSGLIFDKNLRAEQAHDPVTKIFLNPRKYRTQHYNKFDVALVRANLSNIKQNHVRIIGLSYDVLRNHLAIDTISATPPELVLFSILGFKHPQLLNNSITGETSQFIYLFLSVLLLTALHVIESPVHVVIYLRNISSKHTGDDWNKKPIQLVFITKCGAFQRQFLLNYKNLFSTEKLVELKHFIPEKFIMSIHRKYYWL